MADVRRCSFVKNHPTVRRPSSMGEASGETECRQSSIAGRQVGSSPAAALCKRAQTRSIARCRRTAAHVAGDVPTLRDRRIMSKGARRMLRSLRESVQLTSAGRFACSYYAIIAYYMLPSTCITNRVDQTIRLTLLPNAS